MCDTIGSAFFFISDFHVSSFSNHRRRIFHHEISSIAEACSLHVLVIHIPLLHIGAQIYNELWQSTPKSLQRIYAMCTLSAFSTVRKSLFSGAAHESTHEASAIAGATQDLLATPEKEREKEEGEGGRGEGERERGGGGERATE